MKATVSEKGQVTIPKQLRDRLGIRRGEVLDFEEDGGRLVIRKADRRDRVDSVYGVIRLGETSDEFVQRARGRARP